MLFVRFLHFLIQPCVSPERWQRASASKAFPKGTERTSRQQETPGEPIRYTPAQGVSGEPIHYFTGVSGILVLYHSTSHTVSYKLQSATSVLTTGHKCTSTSHLQSLLQTSLQKVHQCCRQLTIIHFKCMLCFSEQVLLQISIISHHKRI